MLNHTSTRILHELSKNSRIKMKELSKKVCLTGQAAASRVAKLEDKIFNYSKVTKEKSVMIFKNYGII